MTSRFVILWTLAAGAVVSAAGGTVAADGTVTEEMLDQFRADNLALYHDLRFEEAEACARAIVLRGGESDNSRLGALSTMVALHCSRGEAEEVAVAVGEMLKIADDALLMPPRRFASPVVQCFFDARDKAAPARHSPGTRQINTIAVGEFRNHSIPAGGGTPFDLDHFAKGLGQLVQFDLSQVSEIELVDRARLASLEREVVTVGGSESLDDGMRIAAGNLCGAHAFLFGHVMMVDGKNIRIGIRLVATATGEILLAERVDGKIGSGEDMIRLEEKLVRELLGPKIDAVVEAYNGKQYAATRRMSEYFAEKRKEWNRNDTYLSFLLESGEALQLEDRGEYDAALRKWGDISNNYPEDSHAANRMLGLRAWLHGQGAAAGGRERAGGSGPHETK